MKEYDRILKERLAAYKRARLGVQEDGFCDKRPYAHLLPEALYRLNILETVRAEFWRYWERNRDRLKLHQGFHHLNSSQAMTFNLFFPWLGLAGARSQLLLEALGVPVEPVADWAFEHVPDSAEGTHFDFALKFPSGRRLLFEVKLSEPGFGTAPPDPAHLRKLDTVYRPALRDRVSPDCLEPERFFAHYQLLRILSHAAGDARIVLIWPRENELLQSVRRFLSTALTPEALRQIDIVHLEDLTACLRVNLWRGDPRLRSHTEMFEEKYVVRGD
jgi:hypothetical protein